jgi:hypothetical protein
MLDLVSLKELSLAERQLSFRMEITRMMPHGRK